MIDDDLVRAHRARGAEPDHPVIRGTAHNPDTFFQAREASNPFYDACPDIVQREMDRFAELVGRQYRLFDYAGAADAERVVVIMGSGGETVAETVARAERARRDGWASCKVRLYRPFAADRSSRRCRRPSRAIAVLDRTKEPGAAGEPLYQDVVTAHPRERGSRTRVSSAAATGCRPRNSRRRWSAPCLTTCARRRPKNHFTVGINDDVTHSSLLRRRGVRRRGRRTPCAACSTASAPTARSAPTRTPSRSSAKGRTSTPRATSSTTRRSRARSPSRTCASARSPIHAPYLIDAGELRRLPPVRLPRAFRRARLRAALARTFLLNSPFGPDEVWDHLPRQVQQQIIDKQLRFYVIDGNTVAREAGMGGRVNTIMQTCFFALSGVLPREEAIERDQARDREDLRQARRSGGPAQFRRGRRRARPPARGEGAGDGDQPRSSCAAGAQRGTGFRAAT